MPQMQMDVPPGVRTDLLPGLGPAMIKIEGKDGECCSDATESVTFFSSVIRITRKRAYTCPPGYPTSFTDVSIPKNRIRAISVGHETFDPRTFFFCGLFFLPWGLIFLIAASAVTTEDVAARFAVAAVLILPASLFCVLYPYCKNCCCSLKHTITIKTDEDKVTGFGGFFFSGYDRFYTVSTNKKLDQATLDAIATYTSGQGQVQTV